jgi:hypothetical protein
MDEALAHEHFAPYVGRRFSFEGHHVTLTLASVTANPQFAIPGSPKVPFTLIFHGPAGDILPEGYYRTTIEDGPVMAFHIMPIHTPAPGQQDYQAVFS